MTEPVGEKFVDPVADAVLARPDASQTELPAAWRSPDVGDMVGEDFGGEFLDGDFSALSCGCFQAASDVVGNVGERSQASRPHTASGVFRGTTAGLDVNR